MLMMPIAYLQSVDLVNCKNVEQWVLYCLGEVNDCITPLGRMLDSSGLWFRLFGLPCWNPYFMGGMPSFHLGPVLVL